MCLEDYGIGLRFTWEVETLGLPSREGEPLKLCGDDFMRAQPSNLTFGAVEFRYCELALGTR